MRRAMMAVQSGRAAGASHPSKKANQQEVVNQPKKDLVHLWRGQLRVGSIDVGAATLWSEYMTCIPALGQILKMTRIARYEDLWHKVLQSQPCQLSKRRPVTIRGRTITVHTLSVHGRLVEQLMAELREAAKPFILTCQLLNDKNYVEVVLVPPCPELEQCGLHGSQEQLHILLVGRRSNTRIVNLHKLLDVEELSRISDFCTRAKTAEDKGLEDSMHYCEESDVPEVKGSTCEVSSCRCDINLTASTDELAEKRECPSDSMAAEMYNQHLGESTCKDALVSSDADQSISPRSKEAMNQTEDMKSESKEGSIEVVGKTEAQKTCGSLQEMPLMDQPAYQTEMRHSECNNAERGVEYSTEDDQVLECEGYSKKDQENKENGEAVDIPEFNSKTQNLTITKDRKLGASKDSKRSKKWKLSKFIKIQKTRQDGGDLCRKRKLGKYSRTLKITKVVQDLHDTEHRKDHSKTWPVKKNTQDHEKEEHKEDSKIHRTVGNLQGCQEKGQHKKCSKLFESRENTQGENLFKRPDLTKSHSVVSTDLNDNIPSCDGNSLNDEKLMKTARVVIQRRSLEKMVQEAKEKLGLCIKVPKTLKVKKNSMLDTKKLKDLFSLSDSNKPDLIKPSMLRSNKLCVFVNEHCEPRVSNTPDILKCLEKDNEKRNVTDVNEASNCQATSLMKETSGNDLPNSMVKRQKTADRENCSLLDGKKKKGQNIISNENIRKCVDNPHSLKNLTESYSPDQKKKKKQHMPATELDDCRGSEQTQEVNNEELCTRAKQTSELKKDVPLISDGRQISGLENSQDPVPHPKHRWKLAYDRQVSNSNGGDLSNTAAQNIKLQHQHEKCYSGSEVKPCKKRKLKCEWFETIENFHPSKISHCIDLPHTQKCLDESGHQIKGASATMGRSSVGPLGVGDIAEKLGSEDSSSRSESVHTVEDIVSGSSSEQDRSKHQQQASEEENMSCLQHLESSLHEPQEVLLQSQREPGERHPVGQCSMSQDCQYSSSPSSQGPGQSQLSGTQMDLMYDTQGDEKYKYCGKNNSPQAILMERNQTSEIDLPCPMALARRVKIILKNCKLEVHSSLRDDLQGLWLNHEFLPLMHASVTTFLMTQNTAQQLGDTGTQKSLSSKRKSTDIKRVMFGRILKNMKLKLLKDANMTNNMDQSHVTSDLKKLSVFIESQRTASLQVTSIPDTRHTAGMKDIGKDHHLSPDAAKSLITQEVAELSLPYKINNVQPLYLATCRIQVVSDVNHEKVLQNSQEQEMATSSGVTIHSVPPKTGPNCLSAPVKKCLPQETPLPSVVSNGICEQFGHSKTPAGIERAVFVPNELYQPLWKDTPLQTPLNWKEDSKFVHLFQGKQQDVIKLKCLLITRKKSYGNLKDVELNGGHVLVHQSVLDQLLASPDLTRLYASSFISFGVYSSLAQVLEGKVPVILAKKCLLLVHHTALLDPNTGAVLQSVSNSSLHLVLLPAHTLYMCAHLLGQQLRTPTDEKLKETLAQNLRYFKKCVEMNVGHILGGSRGSACAILSPQSPITEYLVCLRTIHRCLDFAHRHTAVVIGEGTKKMVSFQQPSVYRLCTAGEVFQDLLKVSS